MNLPKLVVIATMLLCSAGCLSISGTCANETLTEVVAPDGQHKAIVFQRDCGATTGFSTQVTIIESMGSLANESGNTFVADTDHGAAPAGPGGGPQIEVVWRNSNELVVSYDGRCRTFRQEAAVAGVSVIYRTLSPSNAPN